MVIFNSYVKLPEGPEGVYIYMYHIHQEKIGELDSSSKMLQQTLWFKQ